MAVKEASAVRPTARERLLAAANELFYNEGVHTVGIDRIIEQAGVAKASLYNTFGSKDELVRAYLEMRRASVCLPCSKARRSCSPSPATAAARSPAPARNPTPATRPSRRPRPTVTG